MPRPTPPEQILWWAHWSLVVPRSDHPQICCSRLLLRDPGSFCLNKPKPCFSSQSENNPEKKQEPKPGIYAWSQFSLGCEQNKQALQHGMELKSFILPILTASPVSTARLHSFCGSRCILDRFLDLYTIFSIRQERFLEDDDEDNI